MLVRLHLFLLKTPVLIVLGLLAAYLLFCWLAFGPLAQWSAKKFITDKTGHSLTLDKPEFDPLRCSLTVRNLWLADPDGKPLAGFKELFVDFALSSLFRFAWTFDAVRLTGPEGRLALLPGGKLNWTAFIDAFKGKEDEKAEQSKDLPRLLIRHFELKGGRLDFTDQTVAPMFETTFLPLDIALDELSTLPDDKGTYQISARTTQGSQWRWKGEIGMRPFSVTGAFSVEDFRMATLEPYLKGRINIVAPEGTAGFSTHYLIGYDKKKLSLNLDGLDATVKGLRLRGVGATEPQLALDKITVSGGRFNLDQRTFSLTGIELAGGKMNLVRRSDGTLDIQDWFVGAAPAGQGNEDKATSTNSSIPRSQELRPKQPDSRREGDAAEAQPWQVELGRFSLDGIGIHFLDRTFAKPLALVSGKLVIGFKANARFGDGPIQVSVAEGRAALDSVTVASADRPLFAVDGVTVEGVKVSLADKHAEVERLKLERGRLAAVVRAADGSIALLEALKPAGKTAPDQAKTGQTEASQNPGWTWRLGQAELNDFQVALSDQKVNPAAGVKLEAIGFSVAGLTQNLAVAVPVRLGLRVREGGSLLIQGKLVPAKGALDAQVNLSGLSLTPAQPYIGQAANVVLVSGKASSQGRLKTADKISYKGSFSVTDLLVNESETGNRLLAWKSLATAKLAAMPEAVDIGEVKVDGLGLKLIIYKDKTLNLNRLMKPRPVPTVPATPTAPASPPAKTDMRLSVERVIVSASEMDFADESLALPFGTRIHSLKGVLNGIGRAAGQLAQLELAGQIDDYGLARAVGQIDLFNPTGYTDLKVVFRNVEMNQLTPYTATFAGRRIESGKLSLDIEYKIKNRQLQSDNQIIMNKLTLGERVESPTAMNLPLDLAIAILEDSDGNIDLGLPVSGSLDDPQFSYGGIIWKAIVNVITRIVTSPFRALGQLLGIGSEKLEKVVFDAGEARLLPPEKEKLRQVAQALAKRPNLVLTATPVWNPVADRLSVKESRMRRALAEAAGRTLAPDEEPGPVSTAQPKTQEALEKLYTDRFGRDALIDLKRKYAQASPAPAPTDPAGRLLSRLSGTIDSKTEPLSTEELSRLKGADIYGLIYQVLLDRETVTDNELIALAGARGKVIEQTMQANDVQGDKLAMKPVEQVTGEGREVAVKLDLGVARKK